MDVNNVIEYWVESSMEDYKTAQTLFAGKRYAHALFFCHLTIEKTLKALVVQKTATHAPYEHNLQKLLEMAEINLPKDQSDAINEINTFNIKGRYDDEKLEFYKKSTREYTEKYFNETTNLYLWLKRQLIK